MGMGMNLAATIANQMLQDRLKQEAEKPSKGKPKPEPEPVISVQAAVPMADTPGMQDYRAGERQDYATPPVADETSGMTNLAFDPEHPLMGASLFGSGQFTAKELRQGYRKMRG